MELNSATNREQIEEIYRERDLVKGNRYAFYQPDQCLNEATRNRHLAKAFLKMFEGNLSQLSCLDVGCGHGTFLRQLVEWGAAPENMVGSELLKDRIDQARQKSPLGISWHHGGLESLGEDKQFDLVSAFTVFSSILDPKHRSSLAKKMWGKVKPDGWLMVFDFRYNNPSNEHVKKVCLKEMKDWWPSQECFYKTLLLAPPLSRRITPFSHVLSEILCWIPFFKSHFLYFCRKGSE